MLVPDRGQPVGRNRHRMCASLLLRAGSQHRETQDWIPGVAFMSSPPHTRNVFLLFALCSLNKICYSRELRCAVGVRYWWWSCPVTSLQVLNWQTLGSQGGPRLRVCTPWSAVLLDGPVLTLVLCVFLFTDNLLVDTADSSTLAHLVAFLPFKTPVVGILCCS